MGRFGGIGGRPGVNIARWRRICHAQFVLMCLTLALLLVMAGALWLDGTLAWDARYLHFSLWDYLNLFGGARAPVQSWKQVVWIVLPAAVMVQVSGLIFMNNRAWFLFYFFTCWFLLVGTAVSLAVVIYSGVRAGWLPRPLPWGEATL